MKSKILKIITFLFPLLFIGHMLFLRKNDFYVYNRIGAEDNLLEWGQFALYFLSGILAILLAYRHRKNKALLFIHILLSIALLFIAIEEISWGERLFGITRDSVVPIELMERNVQEELNFHNIDTIHSKIGYIYLIIGFFGCFSSLLLALLKRFAKIKKVFEGILRHITPSWIFFFYFFPLFINFFDMDMYGLMPQDYELAETCLALGVFLFLLYKYIWRVDDNGLEPSTPTM